MAEIEGVTIPDLPNAEALTGTEPIETVQDGVSVQTTAQDIANLGASVVEISRADLIALAGSWNLQTTYVITDAIGGGDRVRVFVRSAVELTASAMKEGVDDGTGAITAGNWGNYDLDNDVFTAQSESGNYTPTASNETNLTSINPRPSFYQKVGNVVTIQGYASYEPTILGTCTFDIDLPFDTTNANNLIAQAVTGEGTCGVVSTPTADIATISFASLGAGSTVGFVISYEITP